MHELDELDLDELDEPLAQDINRVWNIETKRRLIAELRRSFGADANVGVPQQVAKLREEFGRHRAHPGQRVRGHEADVRVGIHHRIREQRGELSVRELHERFEARHAYRRQLVPHVPPQRLPDSVPCQ